MAIILTFFIGHWVSSIFSQTFFLHRYGAHKQFTMSKGWERFFHLFTFVAQGSSFLNPPRSRGVGTKTVIPRSSASRRTGRCGASGLTLIRLAFRRSG